MGKNYSVNFPGKIRVIFPFTEENRYNFISVCAPVVSTFNNLHNDNRRKSWKFWDFFNSKVLRNCLKAADFLVTLQADDGSWQVGDVQALKSVFPQADLLSPALVLDDWEVSNPFVKVPQSEKQFNSVVKPSVLSQSENDLNDISKVLSHLGLKNMHQSISFWKELTFHA